MIPFQKDAIRLYAEEHGFEVVATYSDPGKRGIEIKHRPGLRKQETRAAGVSGVVSKSEATSVLITTARGLLDQIAA